MAAKSLIARVILRNRRGVRLAFSASRILASISILRGLIPSGQASMQSPQPLQVVVHATAPSLSEPLPVRKSTTDPATDAAGWPAAAPKGTTGQTSTHFPH